MDETREKEKEKRKGKFFLVSDLESETGADDFGDMMDSRAILSWKIQ